jgi:hypothetical protein
VLQISLANLQVSVTKVYIANVIGQSARKYDENLSTETEPEGSLNPALKVLKGVSSRVRIAA